MEIPNYPGNSHKSREEQTEPKKVEKVIKGTVVTRKKTLSRRFVDAFFGEDIDNVFSYIMTDVLIPSVKSTVLDMIRNGSEMLILGESKGPRRRDDRRSYVHYDRVSYRDDRRPASARTSRSHSSFEDVVVTSARDAEEVRNRLIDLVEQYGIATVADLYDMVDMESSHTDQKWGWDNLTGSRITRVRDGWLIDLPRPIFLD